MYFTSFLMPFNKNAYTCTIWLSTQLDLNLILRCGTIWWRLSGNPKRSPFSRCFAMFQETSTHQTPTSTVISRYQIAGCSSANIKSGLRQFDISTIPGGKLYIIFHASVIPLKSNAANQLKKPAQLSGFTALSLSLWSLGLETRIVVPRTTSFCWKKSWEKFWLQKTPQPRFLRVPLQTQQGLTLRKQINSWGQKIVFILDQTHQTFQRIMTSVPTVPTDFLPLSPSSPSPSGEDHSCLPHFWHH